MMDFALILLSSSFLLLSFPAFNADFLAWVGLVPLMIVLNGRSLRSAFFFSLVCGIVFFLGTFLWVSEVSQFSTLYHGVLILYLALYFGLFGLFYTFMTRRWGLMAAILSAPFLWVSLEYVRGNFFFLALPWQLLGHTQYQHSMIIQIASITGTYGLSFLVVLVNSALMIVIISILYRLGWYKPSSLTPPSMGGIGGGLFITLTVVALFLIYGRGVLSRPISGESVKLAVVQGNIEQKEKWDKRYARSIMQVYADLTQQASKDHPDLIVWPETATPGSISRNVELLRATRGIAKKAGSPLLFGNAQHQKIGEKGDRRIEHQNRASLISSKFNEAKDQHYTKIRLLPFAEYLPLKGVIPWHYLNVPDPGGYTPGEEFTVFELPHFNFSATICWENIFPDLFRQFVRRGAQVMINITNEAWFGRTASPYQFLAMSVFRAVENRIFVVRCGNSGVSCFIDPYGRIIDRVKDENARDIFVRGVLTGTVIPLNSNTFFTRHGDWFGMMSVSFSAVFLLMAFFGKRHLIGGEKDQPKHAMHP
jgi:apolipoprotein N-acyltransferase